jgi:hypothetical protein
MRGGEQVVLSLDGGTVLQPFRGGICRRETDNGYGKRPGGDGIGCCLEADVI